ncbi:MAG: cytochrome o ubiquinol oxidase subunit IV [Sphingomonas oligoaromativorans]|jgi:cytochrome o ubiquinol oxidase operon protein cyoD|uniref:cytochrome o ubiquinol oxidase subunit IV n=1 Tax=Sphingomonas oligoaromativorans TaxID=575322 RepID=UPI001420B1DF|nr:cytochrome o ubiquinol oxidase subunit IV [Sphingomonas oligoaromativorans]NIJ34244.1 cytochrome o ubiquinol oxidase operon protein cyoD [Sphingomonas oligoaromativorans]
MSTAHSQPHADDGAHGSLASYTIGFLLSLALTGLSFGAVMSGAVPHAMILPAIVGLAVVQLLVQLVLFLHLGSAPSQRGNSVIFLLTAALIAILVSGSLWVMHNANLNMMPMQMSAEHAMAHE